MRLTVVGKVHAARVYAAEAAGSWEAARAAAAMRASSAGTCRRLWRGWGGCEYIGVGWMQARLRGWKPGGWPAALQDTMGTAEFQEQAAG